MKYPTNKSLDVSEQGTPTEQTQRSKCQNSRIQLEHQPTLLGGLIKRVPDIADPFPLRFLLNRR